MVYDYSVVYIRSRAMKNCNVYLCDKMTYFPWLFLIYFSAMVTYQIVSLQINMCGFYYCIIFIFLDMKNLI